MILVFLGALKKNLKNVIVTINYSVPDCIPDYIQDKSWVSACSQDKQPGLEIATNTVAFATQLYLFATRKTRVVANLRLGFAVTDANKKG